MSITEINTIADYYREHVTSGAFSNPYGSLIAKEIILDENILLQTKEELEARETPEIKSNRIKKKYTHRDWILSMGMSIQETTLGILVLAGKKLNNNRYFLQFFAKKTFEYDLIKQITFNKKYN